MYYKYGEFKESQISEAKKYIRKQIFFLLLIVDPQTCDEYDNINVLDAFDNTLHRIAGLNSLLFYPTEMVNVMSMLEAALIEYKEENIDVDNFKKSTYRKLILDAGNEVQKIKEV